MCFVIELLHELLRYRSRQVTLITVRSRSHRWLNTFFIHHHLCRLVFLHYFGSEKRQLKKNFWETILPQEGHTSYYFVQTHNYPHHPQHLLWVAISKTMSLGGQKIKIELCVRSPRLKRCVCLKTTVPYRTNTIEKVSRGVVFIYFRNET